MANAFHTDSKRQNPQNSATQTHHTDSISRVSPARTGKTAADQGLAPENVRTKFSAKIAWRSLKKGRTQR